MKLTRSITFFIRKQLAKPKIVFAVIDEPITLTIKPTKFKYKI